jgi:hypothetical protein
LPLPESCPALAEPLLGDRAGDFAGLRVTEPPETAVTVVSVGKISRAMSGPPVAVSSSAASKRAVTQMRAASASVMPGR